LPTGDRAIRRNTQAVRKARSKYGIPIVRPAYIHDSIASGSRKDHSQYLHQLMDSARGPANAEASSAPVASTIAARAVASGTSVMGLDENSDSDSYASSQNASAAAGQVRRVPREYGGISDAKLGHAPDGQAYGESSSDEASSSNLGLAPGRPDARQPQHRSTSAQSRVPGDGRQGPLAQSLAEQQWREALGLPPRRLRRSLVSRAMLTVGTKTGLRRFKMLTRQLTRLRCHRWYTLTTSVRRAFLVGSPRAFARATAAMDEEAAEAISAHLGGGKSACQNDTCRHADHDHCTDEF